MDPGMDLCTAQQAGSQAGDNPGESTIPFLPRLVLASHVHGSVSHLLRYLLLVAKRKVTLFTAFARWCPSATALERLLPSGGGSFTVRSSASLRWLPKAPVQRSGAGLYYHSKPGGTDLSVS